MCKIVGYDMGGEDRTSMDMDVCVDLQWLNTRDLRAYNTICSLKDMRVWSFVWIAMHMLCHRRMARGMDGPSDKRSREGAY